MDLSRYTVGWTGTTDWLYLKCSVCHTAPIGSKPTMTDLLTYIVTHEETDEHRENVQENRL